MSSSPKAILLLLTDQKCCDGLGNPQKLKWKGGEQAVSVRTRTGELSIINAMVVELDHGVSLETYKKTLLSMPPSTIPVP